MQQAALAGGPSRKLSCCMDDTEIQDDRQVERISLLDFLQGQWLKMPLAVVQDVGPAVQTLGGLLTITTREKFVSISNVAERARLPPSTVRKHLVSLNAKGWIDHQGRQRTRRGALRRTATIKLTRKTHEAIEPYGILSWWACRNIRNVGKFPWHAKAVLAVIMARLCSLNAAATVNGPDEDVMSMIDNFGGEDRFRFSLKCLTKQTGLSRDSAVEAKRFLHRHGIVQWRGCGPRPGQNTETDLL